MAFPPDPLPVAPRHGQVVDGQEIELRWAPTDHADTYHVQIAEDEAFEDVVYEDDTSGQVLALVVRRRFPEHGRLFYWRVLARRNGAWSPGDHAETFVSGSIEDEAVLMDPADEEPTGPLPGLFSSASPETAAAQTGASGPEDGPLENLEEAEVVTLGMTFVIAVVLVLGVVLLVLFYAC